MASGLYGVLAIEASSLIAAPLSEIFLRFTGDNSCIARRVGFTTIDNEHGIICIPIWHGDTNGPGKRAQLESLA
jgi:hypothetical protein